MQTEDGAPNYGLALFAALAAACTAVWASLAGQLLGAFRGLPQHAGAAATVLAAGPAAPKGCKAWQPATKAPQPCEKACAWFPCSSYCSECAVLWGSSRACSAWLRAAVCNAQTSVHIVN